MAARLGSRMAEMQAPEAGGWVTSLCMPHPQLQGTGFWDHAAETNWRQQIPPDPWPGLSEAAR